jgi:DNA polymerase-3 subunit gamma/tau
MPAVGGGQTMRLVEPAPEAAPVALPPVVPEAEPPSVPVRSLEDIAALADANRDIAFKVKLKSCVRLVAIEPGRIEVSLTPDAPKVLLNDMTTRLKAWTGRNWFVSVSREEGGRTLAEVEAGRRESALIDARADPAVAAILARFPGAKIIDVRIPDAAAQDVVESDGTSLPIDPIADDDDDDEL